MVLNVRYILSGKSILKLDFKEKFEFRAEVMRDLVRIGIPTALEQNGTTFWRYHVLENRFRTRK